MHSKALILAGSSLAAAKVVKIKVGADGWNAFKPNVEVAQIGDSIEFEFQSANFDVAQGDYSKPCQPKDGGFYSGLMPDANWQNEKVFSVYVGSLDPIWFYSTGQGQCQGGMVGVINAPWDQSQTLAGYIAGAAGTGNSIAPAAMTGGTVYSEYNNNGQNGQNGQQQGGQQQGGQQQGGQQQGGQNQQGQQGQQQGGQQQGGQNQQGQQGQQGQQQGGQQQGGQNQQGQQGQQQGGQQQGGQNQQGQQGQQGQQQGGQQQGGQNQQNQNKNQNYNQQQGGQNCQGGNCQVQGGQNAQNCQGGNCQNWNGQQGQQGQGQQGQNQQGQNWNGQQGQQGQGQQGQNQQGQNWNQGYRPSYTATTMRPTQTAGGYPGYPTGTARPTNPIAPGAAAVLGSKTGAMGALAAGVGAALWLL